jgi:hypothetical protein
LFHSRRLRAIATPVVAVVFLTACTATTPESPPPSGSSPESSVVALASLVPGPASSGELPSAAASAAPASAEASLGPTPTTQPTVKPTAGATPKPTPGPAVTLEVTGLVDQYPHCFTDCGHFPPPDYPRQLVMVRALDAQGRVATGYAGTVTFVNPQWNGGTGGLSDSKLTKGVGLFPVLVPALSFWANNEPWASLCPDVHNGGVGLYVRDTVNPNLRGCQATLGGFYTFTLPAAFETITLPDCATGCFNEPTNTIVIDQNLSAPKVYTATADSMTIRGETHQDQFYSEPVGVAYYYVYAGDAVGLDACVGCTATTPILIQRSDVHLTVQSTLDYGGSTLTADGPLTVAEMNYLDIALGTDSCLYNGTELGSVYCIKTAEAQVALNTGFGPTCYDTASFLTQAFCLGG